jgi:two-component sensor histidine kinase
MMERNVVRQIGMEGQSGCVIDLKLNVKVLVVYDELMLLMIAVATAGCHELLDARRYRSCRLASVSSNEEHSFRRPVDEANHRVIVGPKRHHFARRPSIATHSIRYATSLDDASDKLQSRIAAYSKARDILLQKNWVGATLANIVDAAVLNIGFEQSDRIRAEGPEVELGLQASLSFSLVLHELLTNACKYGALSNAEGSIEVSWKLNRREGEVFLVSEWREKSFVTGRWSDQTGGPPVVDPSRKGFGSRLITSSFNAYGQVHPVYEPEGFVLTIDIPLSKVQFRSELAQIGR